MAVPVIGIIVFALFVLVGVRYRKRPEMHRPMMFMASLSVVAAAVGRMPRLSAWYEGTWWEQVFSAFGMTIVLGALLFAAKCLVSRSFDRWFATAFAALVVASAAISLGARTTAWDQVAMFLLR
jgi:asparagine N-glycosylation enzyme membrane subunit Stt3